MPVGVCGRLLEGKRVSVRVGLVLGAGGVLGGAWLVGGLSALARETGWDPGSADISRPPGPPASWPELRTAAPRAA